MTEEDRRRQNEGHTLTDGDFLTIGGQVRPSGQNEPAGEISLHFLVILALWG
jgi:hypothetical protein